MKVKSINIFILLIFFAKMKPLMTHVCKTPLLRSHYSTVMVQLSKAELLQLNQTQILSLGNFVNEKKREKLPTKKLYQYQHFFEFAFIQFIEGKNCLRSMSSLKIYVLIYYTLFLSITAMYWFIHILQCC